VFDGSPKPRKLHPFTPGLKREADIPSKQGKLRNPSLQRRNGGRFRTSPDVKTPNLVLKKTFLEARFSVVDKLFHYEIRGKSTR